MLTPCPSISFSNHVFHDAMELSCRSPIMFVEMCRVPIGYWLLLCDKGNVTFRLFMVVVAFRMANTLWQIPGYHGVAHATDSGYQTQKYNKVHVFFF